MKSDKVFVNNAMEATIRVGLLIVLATWCFEFVKPFIIPFVWGIIIAVGAHPAFLWLTRVLGGRRYLAAVLIAVLGFAFLLVPSVLLVVTLVENAKGLAEGLGEGSIVIPPPPPGIEGWPVVGEPLVAFWTQASQNLEATLAKLAPHLRGVGSWVLATAAGAGWGLLQFLFAIGIAGVLLAFDSTGNKATLAVARRLAGDRGAEFARLAEATVTSVTRGILGVALIQSILIGLGFLAVGVPGAGLWALLCLILSVIQIGAFPVVVPVLIYVFWTADLTTSILFLLWSTFAGSIDNILKPILLGRGVAVPMAVIFIGAIGGFISSGIIGLFVGAVVLVLGYKLFMAWLEEEPGGGADADPSLAPPSGPGPAPAAGPASAGPASTAAPESAPATPVLSLAAAVTGESVTAASRRS